MPRPPCYRAGLLRLAIWLVLAACPALPAVAQSLEPLIITTAAGPRRFEVEIARDDATRQQGLMFRRSLAPDRGMLFDFARIEPVSMWMQNTYVSLDMIFIRRNGTIARIAADTEPLSTRVISSGEPVLAVLEVAAGTARRLGIRPGDRVDNALFAP